MTKLGAAFWLGLVLATGFTTFKVKYAVQDIEEELNRVRKHTVAEQQEMRVLAAEWTYLTQPERLAELNRRFLQLAPLAAKQLQPRIEDVPLRPPPAAADIVVATYSPVSPSAMPEGGAAAPALPAAVTAVATAAPESSPSRAAVAAAALLGMAAQAAPAAATKPVPRTLDALVGSTVEPAPVRLAKAAPSSLDALIAQIAAAR